MAAAGEDRSEALSSDSPNLHNAVIRAQEFAAPTFNRHGMTIQAKLKRPKPNGLVVKRGTVPPSVFLHTISDKEWEEFIAAACRQRTI